MWLYGKIKTWVTTGNAPVKVGVLVSLIGVGLLLREAGRRDLISVTIEMRLAAVALFGFALLAIGLRLRLRNPIYGLSLQGGAVAVLYLTTYASFGVYDVIGAAPAAAAVLTVTVGAGVLAVRQDSRPLAVLGIIGGFLAPVLTYSRPEDHVTVLGFYAVLSAAILAVAWYKTWPELNLLGLWFTFGIAAFWLWRRFDEDDWSSVQPLIAVLILLYLAIPVLFAIREAPELRRAWTATLVFATPFMGFGVQYLAVGHTSHGSEVSALALALAHGALWVAARRLGRECRQLAEAYAGIAVTFSVIAVPLAFDSYFTATVWAAQGCLLVWAGCRRQQMLTVVAGSLLQVLAAASFGYHLQEALPYPADTAVIANGFLTGAAMLAVASMASGWLMHGARERLNINASMPWIALSWGVGWWITGGLMEIRFQMSAQRLSATLVFVVVSFGAAAAISNRVRWPHLNAVGLLILPTLWVVALTSVAIQSHPLDLYGWVAWPLSIVVFYWFLRFRESQFPRLVTTLHAGAYWLVALLVSVEAYWQVDQAASGVWPIVAPAAAATALTAAILLGGRWLRWPLRAHRRDYIRACAGPTVLLLGIAVTGTVLVSAGDPSPLPYLPLLNPLDVLAAAVVGVAYLLSRQAAAEPSLDFTDRDRTEWTWPLVAVGTALATMDVARTIHHWLDVPWHVPSMLDSTAFQTSLSIVWTLIAAAAMVAGARTGKRSAWVAGASWTAVVIVKLLLVDLAEPSTPGRATSFIGAGLLLLIVGYMAPAAPVSVGPGAAPSFDPMTRLTGKLAQWVTARNSPAKAGVVLALIGSGLLVTEAAEGDVSAAAVEVRLVAVAASALLLLTIGWLQRHRRPTFGLSLQGGAIAVLHVAAYAAFGVHDLVPAAAVMAMVVVITAGAGVLCVAQDSPALAVLGIIGGFLAPVLTYTSPGDHVVVFGFFAILSAGIVAVARFKVWPELNLLGYTFTFGITAYWLWDRFDQSGWAAVQPLVAVLVLLYLAIPVVFAQRGAPDISKLWMQPLVLGTPFMGFGLQYLAVGHLEYGLAVSALALAAACGTLAAATHRLGERCRELTATYAGLGTLFSAIAVPFALGADFTATVWAAQGALLVWIGCRRGRLLAVAGGASLQLLAGCVAMVRWGETLPYPADAAVLRNEYVLAAAVLAVSGLVSGWRMHANRGHAGIHAAAPWLALLWGTGWWLAGGLTEIANQLADARLSASVAFVVMSLGGAVMAARRLQWPHLNILGLLILPTMAAGLCVSLITQDHPLEHLGWAAWPVSMAVLYACLRLRENELAPVAHALSRSGPHNGAGDDTARASARVAAVLHTGGYWLLAVLVGVEVGWQVDQMATGVWPVAAVLGAELALAGGVLWGGRWMRWPLGAHRRCYLMACTGPMLVLLAVAALVAGIVSNGDPEPLMFLPVLNPLALTIAAVVAVGLAWRAPALSEAEHPLTSLAKASWTPALAVASTVLITAETARTVHHWQDVPWELEALASSATLQSALSVIWAAQGALLVWIGCRRGRLLAVAGGGLLQLLAGCVVMVRWGETLPYPSGLRVIANEYVLAAAVVAVSGLVSGWRMHTARGHAGIHASGPWLALLWGTGWWLAGGLTEIANQLSDARLSASIAFVVVSLGGAVAAAGRLRWPHLNILGLLILPAMAAGLCVSLITQDHPLEHLGWAAWPVSMAVLYACLRLRENQLAPVAHALSRSGPHNGTGDDTARASARVAAVLHTGGYWLLAVLVGVEVGWQVDQVATGVWPPAAALGAVLLLVGATLAGRRRLAWPLGAHWRSYVAICTGPMLMVLAVAVLVLAVISDGDPSPLPFVPVLNPLGVLLGLHLTVTLGWRSLAEAEWDRPFPELVERRWTQGLALAGTVLATLETARTVSHWRDIAWDVEALAASTELQTSLSILWALIALSGMVAGVRLARRPVWVAGASFMAVVVAKLFLVDLSSLSAVGRMVSFMVVGVLLRSSGTWHRCLPPRPTSPKRTQTW